MTKVVNLVAERRTRESEDTQQLCEEIIDKCRSALNELDDVAGYALVVWNKGGEMRTVYNASRGPIGPALVPTLAADALNRHVAVMLAQTESDDIDVS
jgi:hypothetical protein